MDLKPFRQQHARDFEPDAAVAACNYRFQFLPSM
jgi:hypothetical protein